MSALRSRDRELFRKWIRELHGLREPLLSAVAQDTGKSELEAYLIEWSSLEATIAFLDSEGHRILEGGESPSPSYLSRAFGPRTIRSRRLPVGRVLVVGTWNYPLALHLSQVLTALFAGNQVTYKPSPETPRFADACGKLLEPVFGPDRFGVWRSSDDECLEAVRNRRFDLVVFTGGSAGAAAFSEACGRARIPIVLEASGGECALFLPGLAGRDEALHSHVDHLLWALFHNSGQTCTAPRYWLVPRPALEKCWIAASSELLRNEDQARGRPPLKATAAESHRRWRTWAEAQGVARWIELPSRPEFCIGRLDDLSKLSPESPEAFGPGALIVGYRSLGEAVAWIESSPWSLASSVFGEPNESDRAELSRLSASVVSLNEAVIATGDPAVSMAGRSASGHGAWSGREGLERLTRGQAWVEARAWPGASRVGLRPVWSQMRESQKWGRLFKEIKVAPVRALWGAMTGLKTSSNDAHKDRRSDYHESHDPR